MNRRPMLLRAKNVRSSLKRFCKKSRALWLLFLLPLLISCSHSTTQYVQVPVTPIPASLTAECPVRPAPNHPNPQPSERLSYGEAVQWNELLLTDLKNCNSQISGIRQIEEARQK